MLKKLQIHQFRHVEPGTTLEFAEGFNVLLGKNGTGKTTLLELISKVVGSDFSSLRREAFDIEYEFANEHGQGKIRFQNRRLQERRVRPKIPVAGAGRNVDPRDQENEFEPRVSMTLQLQGEDKLPLLIEIEGQRMRWQSGGGEWQEAEGFVDVFVGNFLYYIRSRHAWNTVVTFGMDEDVLFGQNSTDLWAYRFDESLQIYDRIVGGDPRLPPISFDVYYEGDNSYSRGANFVPSSYEPNRPNVGQSSVQVTLPPESTITKLSGLAGFESMAMSFAVKGSIDEGEGVTWQLGHAEFMFSRPGGVINHQSLSYGQKRLLAFLYYLDANDNYVIADELVNGMHHEWIRACIDLIGKRQAFLTSQNPLLLDYIPLESAEHIKRTFLRCSAKTSGERTTFVWANLSDDEAQELFADHEVGIQPIGELLRVRGLW